MFLSYIAGTISLILAVSTFIPWVTIWFYSLKGIDSMYGIITLVMGLLGITLSIFQYLSGKIRGRAYMIFSLTALTSQFLYFRKMFVIGERVNELASLITDVLGETVRSKAQELLGEQWTNILAIVVKKVGITTSYNAFDFLGGGLVLAVGSALALLVVALIIETKKPQPE